MKDVFKDLGISLKGAKNVFNFLSDEDLKNLLKINNKLPIEDIKVR